MKICFVGSAKSIHMQRFAKWFVDRGYEVHLITSSPTKIDGVKIHLIGNGKEGNPFNFISKIVQTRKLVKKIKPDILHAHYAFGPGVFGAFSGFHPFILTTLGSDILVDPSLKLKKIAVKHALKKADAVSCINNNIKPKLIELKCSENKIVPLRIAMVDTNKFHPSKKSKTLRKHIGCENDFLVINARPSIPIYHLDVFIQSVPLVLKKMPNVKFIVPLRPSFGPTNYKIKELIKRLNIENNVICIETVPHSKMPDYLASADLYVDSIVSTNAMMDESFTDENSGIGTTTLEAMSCGTPVLIANKNKIDKYPYRTYYPLDSQDLADKIVDLLKNEELRKHLKKFGREFAIRTADMTVHMKKWEKLYQKTNLS